MFAMLMYSALMWLAKRLMAAENVQEVRSLLSMEGTLMLVVIFIALGVMLYILRLAAGKHDVPAWDPFPAAPKAESAPSDSEGTENQ